MQAGTRLVVGAGLVTIAATVGALALRGDAETGPPRRPNIVLIVIDTLRADHVGCIGNPRGLTPAIDALAAGGVVFRRAYAQSSWTKPSIASLLTSRYQSDHGVIGFESQLAEREITLPEVLRDNGYATGAFVANPVLRDDMGFAQGYEHYEVAGAWDVVDVRTREWMNMHAVRWVRQALPRPFFLYLQYMEPHVPYRPTAKFAMVFEDRPWPDLRLLNRTLGRNLPLSPEMLADAKDVYDAEVAEADRRVGVVLDALRGAGALDDAIVVVTADHGEEFVDHGGLLHGSTLYEEVIHVPLVFVATGGARGVGVDEPVELIDVAPTLLDLAGVPASPSFRGRSRRIVVRARGIRGWVEALAARWSSDRAPAFSELAKSSFDLHPDPDPAAMRRAVVHGVEKAIVAGDGSRSFYDLAVDPAEQSPDALSPAARDDLQTLLTGFARPLAPSESRPIDDTTREQLRALGYVD